MLLIYTILKTISSNDNSIHRDVYFSGNAGKQRDMYTHNRDEMKKLTSPFKKTATEASLLLGGERRAELGFPCCLHVLAELLVGCPGAGQTD